jgi:cytochrome c-type biogenesis protein CcmH
MNKYFLYILIIFFTQNISHAFDEKKYNIIIENLRCLVCQNQSLSESDSNLAKDLRSKVKNMLNSGKSEDDIYKFMSDRYTDYVLYNPPINKSTFFLWFSPFLILFISLVYLYFSFRKNENKITEDKEAVNKKNTLSFVSNSILDLKKIYIILIIFVPVITLSIYSYSSEYLRYKISYYFQTKEPVIDITVSIHEDILSKINGNEVLFVYARNSNGMRVPLAIDIFDVVKSKKNYTIRLDNTMSMIESHTLSSAKEVIVEARISKYKKAMIMPGDFIGSSNTIVLDSSNYVLLSINSIVNEE